MQDLRTWAIGAGDTEMQYIESLLLAAGERVVHATLNGQRVRPSDAYRADGPVVGGDIVLVECDISGLTGSYCVDAPYCGCIDCQGAPSSITRIDHHREGDPGYGLGPDHFLPASSIGQVLNLLAQDEIPVTATGPYFHPLPMLNWRPLDKGDRAYRPYPIKPGLHWLEFLPEDGEGGFPMGRWALVIRTSGPVPLAAAARAQLHDEDREINGQVVKCDCIYHTKKPILWWASLSGGHSPHLQDILHAAAGDHCPADAYQGRCPGVNPDALMRWRVESKAQFQKRSADEILADVERAREIVRRAKRLEAVTADGRPTGRGLGATNAPGNIANLLRPDPRWLVKGVIPELPEAALREGHSYITTFLERGRKKVVLQCASPEEVEWFLSAFPAQEKYGVPMRGFAGGFVPQE